MESENSYSGESNNGSGSSSDSSDSEEETLEPVNILGNSLQLPQELCEDYGIFKEFFSMRTWQSLDDKEKQHLRTFLPTFTENEEEERDKTVNMLLNREHFLFTSPLIQFFHNLKQGNYRPDIAKMKKFLIKARTKQQRQKMKSYYAKLLPEVLISRERLLAAAKAAPPGPTPRLPLLTPKLSSKSYFKSPHVRARQRYFEELAAIRSEVGGEESEDDNYPEGPPTQASKRKRQHHSGQNSDGNVSGTLGATDPSRPTSLNCLKNILAAHRGRRHYRENHPELNTMGITLDDIKQRVALVNGTKKLMFGSQKGVETPIQILRRGPKKENSQKQLKPGDLKPPKAAKVKDQERTSDVIDNKQLIAHSKIKHERESDSESSSFVDPVCSPKQMKQQNNVDDTEIKQEVMDTKLPDDTSGKTYTSSKIETVIKQEPMEVQPCITQPVPIKLEDLDGIDMMALPVELAEEGAGAEAVARQEAVPDASLMETTYANFLSLVRALFPARAAHRSHRHHLHARTAKLMRSPIAPLNTWYSLSDDWCAELDSALDFLAGEKGPHPGDFVPYVQFMPETQMYQWIGAGRDCDANLGRLCERWLRARVPHPSHRAAVSDPPAPRYPTTWTVQPATNSELADFRSQERRRFASPVKPFTYVQHGYRSAVGPCVRGAATCAAHAALLSPERPRHATFMALVRDAVARLPNGEGSQQDVLALLKMSQWVVNCNEQVLLTALSSVLERLHAAKRDPLLRYDQRTNIWIYLYRHRSEEDWSKPSGGRARVRPAAALATPAPPMDMEVGSIGEFLENASDSDVDVDDSGLGAAPPRLSSAQMLMQATRAKPRPVEATKPKTVEHTKPRTVEASKPKTVEPSKPKTVELSKPKTIETSKPKTVEASKPKIAEANKSKLVDAVKTRPTETAKQRVAETAKARAVEAAKSKPIEIPKLKPVETTKPKLVEPAKPKLASLLATEPASPSIMKAKPKVTLNQQPQPPHQKVVKTSQSSMVATLPKSSPSLVTTKSTLIKQRPLQKVEQPQKSASPSGTAVSHAAPVTIVHHSVATTPTQNTNKAAQGTRSLLLRPVVSSAAPVSSVPTAVAQVGGARRGMVRVLSPAAPAVGKSLISPRSLLQQGNQSPATAKRRLPVQTSTSATTIVQSSSSPSSIASNVLSTAAAASGARTVQLSGGRTVHLAAKQTVQLPGGQTVQLSPAHALQLSALQLSAHSVRLPSGQTVQLAARAPPSVPAPPVSAAQTVHLTGHTVKLPGGQTVQLTGGQNVQTVQLAGQNVHLGAQTVQLTGQTVQLGGQTVQLPSGQTLQLPSGQTVQLSSGQTIQLASGQTVQLTSPVQTQKPMMQHVVRTQHAGDKTTGQPIVAKLLTNAQGQMISLEGMVSGGRTLQLAGTRGQAPKTLQAMQGVGGVSGVRVVTAPGARVSRPLLLTSAKPLHNIILQQSDGASIRVTSSSGVAPTQTIVLGNLGGQTGAAATSSTPVLKLQQVNPIQQIKLSQGIKIQQALQPVSAASSAAGAGTASGASAGAGAGAGGTVRSVLMDGQQLKLVSGKHVLARLLRPAHPP